MARQTKAEKSIETRISDAYRKSCSGIQVNMMDLGKIFAHARQVISTGADDTVLGQKILEFVQTIRKN